MQHVEVTGQSEDGFVSTSDATDNVPGRPGDSAKWLPTLMWQQLQKKAGSLMNIFQGKKNEKKWDK